MVFISKVNWDNEVDTIRAMGLSGMTVKAIGEHYGVTKQRISQIIKKKRIFSSEDITGIEVKKNNNALQYRLKWGDKDVNDLKYQSCREKFRSKKANALRSGIEFTVDFGLLEFPTHCPVLGIELDYFAESGKQDNNPSFDRKDPNLGYVNGNVYIISWRANRLKNNGTAEEHRQIYEWMLK